MNANSKHTPGPWSIPHFATDHGCGCGYVFGRSDIMGAVATVGYTDDPSDWAKYGDDPPREEAIANAHLIAAAPTMLKVLREVAAMFPPENLTDSSFRRRVLDAIAEAQGEVSK